MAFKLATAGVALGSVFVSVFVAGCGDPAVRTIEAPDEAATAEPVVEKEVADLAGPNALTCNSPVSPDDTAASLLERYGMDARRATLAGGEGTEIPGVELWFNDPARKLEVGFDGEARQKITFVRTFAPSQWNVAGVAMGNTLEQVVETNGAPVGFYGFEWDYSGTVFDLGGGKLDRIGSCSLSMGFSFDYDKAEIPNSLMGDREVSSESKDIPEGAVAVGELGLVFGG